MKMRSKIQITKKSLVILKEKICFNHLTTISYAIVQPCLGTATIQDAQFTSWWHEYPKPDFNEINTHPTRIKHGYCSHKKGVSRALCSFQAGALLSQQKQLKQLHSWIFSSIFDMFSTGDQTSCE